MLPSEIYRLLKSFQVIASPFKWPDTIVYVFVLGVIDI